MNKKIKLNLNLFKKSTLLFLLITLTIFSLNNLSQENSVTIETLIEQQSTTQMVIVNTKDDVLSVQLDEYLVGVVAGEMPLTFEDEALKAQIVASRTYVANRNFNVSDDVSNQVYLSEAKLKEKWQDKYITNYNRIKKLVLETANQVLTYNDAIISAVFFSTSNGRTENADNYWTQSVAYLQAVDSPWDSEVSPVFTDQKSYSRNELENIFNVKNFHIEIVKINENNRVAEVSINGIEYTGRQIREILGLRSTDFTIEQIKDEFIFHTTGFGHGIGMSQYGAHGMAINGYNYYQILFHYYTGTKISYL